MTSSILCQLAPPALASSPAVCPLIPRLFLDVEGKPQATPEYLAAWMGQVAAVTMPCVYMPNRVNPEYFGQWAALENAHKFLPVQLKAVR